MKKILALHTGGTISMSENDHGVSPNGVNPLIESSYSLPSDIELVVEDVFNLPSPHITLEHMMILKKRIEEAIYEGFGGVVITHGTDTLEETAYFLDLTIGDKIPIVITGAMRSHNELGSDGLYNFTNAIRVASTDFTLSFGVLVVMNDEIHSAHFVTKMHTTNIATFDSTTGPIGYVNKNRVNFVQQIVPTFRENISHVSARVPIVKAYAGMNGILFDALADADIDGLVVEALGAGNLPPDTIKPLKKLIAKGVPIAIVSRCIKGSAEPIYSYEGGGIELEELGLVFVPSLNAPKARIKMIVGLDAGLRDRALTYFLKN
ncbi:MAG: asparaginase [Lactobacillales bacterium]|jgi:L-asparaginase|nr:asparaginase [Lactobacillales bacterium]